MITLEIETLNSKIFTTWFYLQNVRTGQYRARVAAQMASQAMMKFAESMEVGEDDLVTVRTSYDEHGRPMCSYCDETDPDDQFFRVHYAGFLGQMCQQCKESLKMNDCMVFQKNGIWYAIEPPRDAVLLEKLCKPLPPHRNQPVLHRAKTKKAQLLSSHREQKKPGNQPGKKHESTLTLKSVSAHDQK
jgi:hypothetical protein